MNNKHALLSASGANRWLECTPSAKFELEFPKQSSSYADEGTAAHELCELTARYWLGETAEMTYENELEILSKGKYYNGEMQDCANDYGKFINEKLKAAQENCPDAFVELEKKLDFSEWVPEGFGTGDCIIVADDVLEIIDFKYGKGVRVDAENNPQMRLYALGALKRYSMLYDIERIRMTIIQPRISSEPSTSEMTFAELINWAETYVKPRAKLAISGEGEFNPNEDTCKFCRAREQCGARADKFLSLFDTFSDINIITPNEAGEILERAAGMKSWLADLENLVTRALFEGTEFDNWKLVEGRSVRKFTDEIQVAEAMKKAGYEEAVLYKRELISLSAMEKAFGKKDVTEILKDFIIKPPGNPTLAPMNDKRPAVIPDDVIIKAFDDDYEE